MLTTILVVMLAKLIGELAIFYYMPPKLRCWLLSHQGLIAFAWLGINLWLGGQGVLNMTAALASFSTSIIVIKLARWLWGWYFTDPATGVKWFIHGRWQTTPP